MPTESVPPSPHSPKPRQKGLSFFLIAVGAAVLFVLLVLPAILKAPLPKRIERISEAEPALQAASQHAQSQLDTFTTELANPKAGERFAVDGAFQTPSGNEYLWVADVTYANGVFTGRLDQVPIAFSGAKRGDTVTVARSNVYDWMIKDGDTIQGAFTQKALSTGRS